MKAEEIERSFTISELKQYNHKLSMQVAELTKTNQSLEKHQNYLIEKKVIIEVKKVQKDYEKQLSTQAKDYKKQLNEKDKVITKKDKEIEQLKLQLAKANSKLNNDSTNSGLPTSKTPLNKKKLIPNTREKTDKLKGGQPKHKKHKLEAFKEDEATEIVEVEMTSCPKCGSTDIKETDTSVNKCETDYTTETVKRLYKYKEYVCSKCGCKFHANIPVDLKEENQYGKTLQSLCVCLTNEIYTPFNKTVKLVSGITNGEINLSEGYVTKLQKRASDKLDNFVDEVEQYIRTSPVYGWDEGVITVDTKQAVLRTYCTDNVALFFATDSKSKESIDKDGILPNTPSTTLVMHDHVLTNYNDDYCFENVECLIHLIRRLEKMYENTKHEYLKELKHILSEANKDRNNEIKKKNKEFSEDYIKNLHEKYRGKINQGYEVNEKSTMIENPFKKEEHTLLDDLVKYEENYLKWADNFTCPSTNNNSERSLRPAKSKQKISGQFQSLEYASYYARIRSYIETCKRNGINIIEACVRLMNGNPYSLVEIIEQKKDN